LTCTGISGVVRAAAPPCARVVRAAARSFPVGAACTLTFGAAPTWMLTVLGWASPLPLGPSMSLALHGASAPALGASTLGPGAFGRAAARTFTAFVSPKPVVRFRLTA